MLLPRTLKCLNSILYPSSQFASLLCKFGIFLHLYPKFSFLFFFILCNCTCVSLCLYLLCIFFIYTTNYHLCFYCASRMEWGQRIHPDIRIHFCTPFQMGVLLSAAIWTWLWHTYFVVLPCLPQNCERRFVENHLLSDSVIQISQPT